MPLLSTVRKFRDDALSHGGPCAPSIPPTARQLRTHPRQRIAQWLAIRPPEPALLPPHTDRHASAFQGQFSVSANIARDSTSSNGRAQSEREQLTRTEMSAEFVKANERYVADFGDKGSLPILPAKKLTIGACRCLDRRPSTRSVCFRLLTPRQ